MSGIGITYFSDMVNAENDRTNFYPKTLKVNTMKQLSEDLENLLFLLPKTGQLKYQYLDNTVKKALNTISQHIVNTTNLAKPYAEYMKTVTAIAKTYGNSEKSIAYQMNKSEKQVLKDIGNDVLATIKSNHMLEQLTDEKRQAFSKIVGQEVSALTTEALAIKLAEPEFQYRLRELSQLFPKQITPKHEVLKDSEVSGSLRALTLECSNYPETQNCYPQSESNQQKRRERPA